MLVTNYNKQTTAFLQLPWAHTHTHTQDQLAAPGSLLFKPNMRLEAKDRQNPQNPNMMCVATIADIRDGKLLIHFDGWSTRYDYWCKPSSADIHPAMWSGKNQKDPVHPPYGNITV